VEPEATVEPVEEAEEEKLKTALKAVNLKPLISEAVLAL
jgi:hypothetical protein